MRHRDLTWKRRDIFKRFAQIKGVKHNIKLKTGVEPICGPPRRRSLKEEELERTCTWKLVKTAVTEHSKSPWTASNVFVPEESR